MRVEHSRVRPDRVHLHALDRLGRGDQHVRQPAGRQFDDEVVHGDTPATLDHVDAEDVGTDPAERGRHRAQRSRAVRELYPDQEGQGERLLRRARNLAVRTCCRAPILADGQGPLGVGVRVAWVTKLPSLEITRSGLAQPSP
nr:hypothetical protein [Kibdelosporangium sp. MJ126-NF4]